MTETSAIDVLVGADVTEQWSIERQTLSAHRSYRLIVQAPDGTSWSAEAHDVFGSLMKVREQIEPTGALLCCNGARRNAWSSGMQRDMGQGLFVYLLSLPRTPKPPQVRTLDPAPPSQVVSAAEQQAWYRAWLASFQGSST